MLLPRIERLLPLLLTVSSTAWAQNVGQVAGLNAGDIALPIRKSWCQSQVKTCSQLCTSSGQTAGSNTCDVNQLSWLCVCEPDGVSPDISSFSNSLASLACNWQLNECLTNGTTSSATCAYEYVCGGRNPNEPLGSSSSSSAASSFSAPTTSSTAASLSTNPVSGSTSPQQPPSTSTSTTTQSQSHSNTSFAWVAGAVIGLLALIAIIFFTLWWRKRKQRPPSLSITTLKARPTTSSSIEHLWDKAELDSKPAFKAELHGYSRSFQLAGHPNDSASELEGSVHQPAELDGSSPLPVELSPVSPRMVRSNAYAFHPPTPVSPLSESSTFMREGGGGKGGDEVANQNLIERVRMRADMYDIDDMACE